MVGYVVWGWQSRDFRKKIVAAASTHALTSLVWVHPASLYANQAARCKATRLACAIIGINNHYMYYNITSTTPAFHNVCLYSTFRLLSWNLRQESWRRLQNRSETSNTKNVKCWCYWSKAVKKTQRDALEASKYIYLITSGIVAWEHGSFSPSYRLTRSPGPEIVPLWKISSFTGWKVDFSVIKLSE